jgi:hypothetical protein
MVSELVKKRQVSLPNVVNGIFVGEARGKETTRIT